MESSKQKELDFIKNFIASNDFGYEVCLKQLRSLWTAYCLHNNIECDTDTYTSDLLEMWTELEKNRSNPWCNNENDGVIGFARFDMYICEEVV